MNKVIVITGPTAVGKTKMSIELAKKINGEIINADSTQIFRNLDIATAKVTESEKENIKHHLFDIKDITENYTVFDYQRDCRKKIKEIEEKGKTPILVGGTGLYIKAALYDYKFEEEKNIYDFSNYSNEELYDKLKKIDSNMNIHINNRKRLERAFAYYKENNKMITSVEKSNEPIYNVIFIGLTTDRQVLYDRINKRVDLMLKNGLLKEAKEIYNTNIRTKAVMTPIGYKELFTYFDGNCSLEESINLIKQKSRNYAKKQYTWFNHQIKINWFNVNFDDFNKTIEEVYDFILKKDN